MSFFNRIKRRLLPQPVSTSTDSSGTSTEASGTPGATPGASEDYPSILRDFSSQRDLSHRTDSHTAADVARHYDALTEQYQTVYGEVLQAYRPTSIEELLTLQLEAANLQDGMSVLDAGCGVGGPVIWFAQRRDIQVEALTISGVQVEVTQKAVDAAGLTERIRVKQGDYHHLEELYPSRTFDRVLFLESLCHAEDYRQVLQSVRQVLKPGGCVYIKDYEPVQFPEDADKQSETNRRYTQCYHEYHIALSTERDLLDLLEELGFHVELNRIVPIRMDPVIQVGFEKHVGFHWREGLKFSVANCFEILACRVEKED